MYVKYLYIWKNRCQVSVQYVNIVTQVTDINLGAVCTHIVFENIDLETAGLQKKKKRAAKMNPNAFPTAINEKLVENQYGKGEKEMNDKKEQEMVKGVGRLWSQLFIFV